MTRNECTARCRVDDYRRKLVGLFGRVAARKYAIDPVELAGFVRCYNRRSHRWVWLRVKGRATVRYTEPSAYRRAFDACTPDELRQLRHESLFYNRHS